MVEKNEDFIEESADSFDDVDIEDVEEMAGDKLKKIREELKECQKERQEFLDGWQRAKADVLNSKKRSSEELARTKERSVVEHVEKLLPLCDSFSMAVGDDAWSDAPESWRKGIEQTYDQLQKLLAGYGVEEVGAVGETFDPHIHEAVSNAPVTKEKDHHVVQSVLQHGYCHHDRLIRPAKVVVGEYTKQ